MVISMGFSLLLIMFTYFGLPVGDYAGAMMQKIDFSKLLMEGMLGLLLFAGAIHVNLDDLVESGLEIGILATLGVLTSTFLVGGLVYLVNSAIGLGLRLIECMLFGALISPTDPIAVLGIMKKAGAPKSLETKIAGESLFNDGFGVVVFLLILDLATGTGHMSTGHALMFFCKEALGGIMFGLVVGYLGFRLLKTVNNYQVEIMLTLAMVMGGYTLATELHLSAPIAIVLIGLLIGNHGRRLAMSDKTREHLDTFWELVDDILNALLFVLIGLEVLVLSLNGRYLVAGLLAIPIVIFSRWISVGVPVSILRRWRTFSPRAVRIMTWSGLRGGISVALALSLPAGSSREQILTMTYLVVIFSVVVQGLTLKYLVPKKTTV